MWRFTSSKAPKSAKPVAAAESPPLVVALNAFSSPKGSSSGDSFGGGGRTGSAIAGAALGGGGRRGGGGRFGGAAWFLGGRAGVGESPGRGAGTGGVSLPSCNTL